MLLRKTATAKNLKKGYRETNLPQQISDYHCNFKITCNLLYRVYADDRCTCIDLQSEMSKPDYLFTWLVFYAVLKNVSHLQQQPGLQWKKI